MKRSNAIKIYRCFLYGQLHSLKFHSRTSYLAVTISKICVRPDGQSNKEDYPALDLM